MKTLKLLFAAIAAVCCSLVAEAADPVTYLDWDPVKRQMTNVTCSSYVVVTNGIEVFEAGTTYVVNDWVTAPFSVFVNGTESEPTILVLCDGGWLTVDRGVEVTDGHKLVICEQADGDEEATRQLTSTGCNDYAGIGGGWNGACGTIVINGGIVNATGGYQSAGIGGGFIGGNKDGGTAVKATVPVLCWDDEGTPQEGNSDDYVFAPFLVIAKDGTVYRFERFSSAEDGGFIYWVSEDGESAEEAGAANADFTPCDKRFAELVSETVARSTCRIGAETFIPPISLFVK